MSAARISLQSYSCSTGSDPGLEAVSRGLPRVWPPRRLCRRLDLEIGSLIVNGRGLLVQQGYYEIGEQVGDQGACKQNYDDEKHEVDKE